MTLATDKPTLGKTPFDPSSSEIDPPRLTLEEYLAYDDGTDNCYELIDGVLLPMSLGTGKHGGIIRFLANRFDQESERIKQDWIAIQGAVGIQSPRRTRWDTCRIPDITVLTLELWDDMQEREAVIRLNDGIPLLVVEVVSPSTVQIDYRAKHSEYAVLDIPEYWIIDPAQEKVTVCIWVEGRYEDVVYEGEAAVVSATFPELSLTAAQVLSGGRS